MRQLSSIDDNFAKAWDAYRPKAGYYALLILALTFVAMALFLLVAGLLAVISIPTIMALFEWLRDGKGGVAVPSAFHFVWIGIAFILLIISLNFIKSWQTASLWLAITSPTHLRISEVLKQSAALSPRYLGLSILHGFIVFGGTMLFIVPGIIFSGWFVFSGIAAQKNSIIDSLKMSRALVVTRWWSIVLRLTLGLFLASFIPQMTSSFITGTLSASSGEFDVITALGILIAIGIAIFQAFFLMQWYRVYKYSLYLDAQESRESTPSELPAVPQAE